MENESDYTRGSQEESSLEFFGIKIQRNHKIIASIALILLLAAYIILTLPRLETASSNLLAISNHATVKGEISVPIAQTLELSKLSRSQIFKIRADATNLAPQLLAKAYSPSGVVFAGMESGLSWFSLRGFFYYGRSGNSVKGKSSESRYIANPYLLVAPEFWSLSRWGSLPLAWNTQKLTAEIINKPDPPFYCSPSKQTWNPAQTTATVEYNLTEYIDRLSQYTDQPLPKSEISLGLVAYNARDFGFNYLAIDKEKSTNISSYDTAENPVEITDRIIALQAFCSFAEACNHQDIPMPDTDAITIGNLPSTLTLRLWYNKPNSSADPANMYFTLSFI